VRRVADLIVRNWPLKLGAVILATILYSGLVFGQNVRTWNGTLPVEVFRQPAGTTMLSDVEPVTQVSYRAPLDVGVVSPTFFRASIDLATVQPQAGGPAVSVPVTVIAVDSRIQVVDYQPREIPVQLDPVATKEMPVIVKESQVPSGISTAPAQIDPQNVQVTGASSRVDVVSEVIAPVVIDTSGLNVDREIDLIAVDSNGNQVPNVDLEPDRARVRIAVARVLANVTLPVVPQIVGVPAPGYRIASVTVEPLVVTLSGEESIVSQLQTGQTEPIDVTDRTTDLEAMVPFEVPDGVSVSGSDSARVVITIEQDIGTRTFVAGFGIVGTQCPCSYRYDETAVAITLGGPVAEIQAVDELAVVAEVDVTGLAPGTHTVPLTLTAPAGLELVSIDPAEIEVTVESTTPEPEPTVEAAPSAEPDS
jgi:YbbR domain-containing protein